MADDPVNVAVRTRPVPLRPKIHVVNFAAKADAIRCYKNKSAELFGPARAGIEAMADHRPTLAEERGSVERVWYTA